MWMRPPRVQARAKVGSRRSKRWGTQHELARHSEAATKMKRAMKLPAFVRASGGHWSSERGSRTTAIQRRVKAAFAATGDVVKGWAGCTVNTQRGHGGGPDSAPQYPVS